MSASTGYPLPTAVSSDIKHLTCTKHFSDFWLTERWAACCVSWNTGVLCQRTVSTINTDSLAMDADCQIKTTGVQTKQ